MPRPRLAHLPVVLAGVLAPPHIGPWLRQRPRHHVLTRRQLRQPHVEVVAGCEILFPHAARRAPDGTEPGAFARSARGAQADDAYRHLARDSTCTTRHDRGSIAARVSPPSKTITLSCGNGGR